MIKRYAGLSAALLLAVAFVAGPAVACEPPPKPYDIDELRTWNRLGEPIGRPPASKTLKTVGRIVVRTGKIAGLFHPGPDGLEPGIYELTDVLGTITVSRVGDLPEPQERVDAVDLDGLLRQSMLTQEEIDNLPENKDDS